MYHQNETKIIKLNIMTPIEKLQAMASDFDIRTKRVIKNCVKAEMLVSDSGEVKINGKFRTKQALRTACSMWRVFGLKINVSFDGKYYIANL